MQAPRPVEDSLSCAVVGESPIWDPRSSSLYWADLLGGELHRYRPGLGDRIILKTDQPVGGIGLHPDPTRLVVAAQREIWSVAVDGGDVEILADLGIANGLRVNDAQCDRVGRFWVGVVPDEPAPGAGSLLCASPDGSVSIAITGLSFPNGIGWSPEGDVMYVVDTLQRTLLRCDFDEVSGYLGEPAELISFPEEYGFPDGMTVTADGSILVAFWAGSAVRRFDAGGTPLEVIWLPVDNVTSCALGGDRLADLYVTTASHGMSEEEREGNPAAGRLFVLPSFLAGRPANTFGS